ncbi:extracellular solute-binding protein [Paenibacillus sp. MSJ-34]|uniref:extracellular solute-binding protein n=1 Tax=Paenibacillus sp. MSJ-34 TaxID=2841529 RepID=UPI001C120F04|nr:extracellular solute-binding protein [Paenibacillus sp. MSJ-34]MBU5441232.1 extracellular solute-binding protein [Paenibacillus sp. MSJ-34]
MTKKRILWGLVLAMLMLAATACGSGKTAEESRTEDNNAAGGGTKPTLKILGNFAPNLDPNKDLMVQEIEKTTGYKVEFAMLPQDKPDEKLNLEIASGANYDIVMLTAPQFYKLAAQGALRPIDDLIEQYGQNLKKVIKEETWELSRVNGQLYGIPQKNERPNIEDTIVYRQDILEELKLPVPTTAEEFYATLQAVKKAKPELIPLTGRGAGDIRTLLSGFGIFTDWTEQDGKLIYRFEMPEFKEYLAYMSKLYQENLLDQDWGVNKVASMQEKFMAGKAFAMQSSWFDSSKVGPTTLQNVPGAKLGYLDPLKDNNGNAGIQANLRIQYIHAIPKSAKHAEDAIQYIDAKLEPDNFTYLTLGEENVTFTQEDDKYTPIMPIFSEKRGTAYWFLNGIDEYRYPDMWLARLRRDPTQFEVFERLNKEYDKYARMNPVSLAPPIEAVTKYEQTLRKMEEDYFVKVIMGTGNLNDHEGFLQEWGAAGGQEINQGVNEWYQKAGQ